MNTKEGGKNVSKSLRAKYGDDYWKKMGAIGGKVKVPKGFAVRRDLAVSAGRKGGKVSRRVKK